MPSRNHPAHGILVKDDETPMVFLTVCTKGRQQWLVTEDVHRLIRETWVLARAWLVGRYVLMPDHIHLFAASGTNPVPFDNWVHYWKSQFSKAHKNKLHRWQTDQWDSRLRSFESYEEKWNYVRNNPVRHKLVKNANDWPFQGELNELRWD